jgi:hypothetical protein
MGVTVHLPVFIILKDIFKVDRWQGKLIIERQLINALRMWQISDIWHDSNRYIFPSQRNKK